MKTIAYVLCLYGILLLSCNRNDTDITNITKKDLSKNEFNQAFSKLNIKALKTSDLVAVMKRDPDVMLFANRISRNAEMILRDEFKVFGNGKFKNAIKNNNSRAELQQFAKTAKDKKGKSMADYKSEMIKNYITVYYKYVSYKKVPKENFREALKLAKPTRALNAYQFRNDLTEKKKLLKNYRRQE